MEGISTCFTTGAGIYNVWMDDRHVVLRFYPDGGDEVVHIIPSYKFAWMVRDFNKHVLPAIDAENERMRQWLGTREDVEPRDAEQIFNAL